MNKATIVEDAITYIETQQNIVLSFSYELHEMEATSKEIKPKKEEIKNWFNFYSWFTHDFRIQKEKNIGFI